MEFSILPLPDIYLSSPDNVRRLVILGVLGFSIFFVSIMNYVLAAVASFSRRAKAVGVHKCCGADGTHVGYVHVGNRNTRCYFYYSLFGVDVYFP